VLRGVFRRFKAFGNRLNGIGHVTWLQRRANAKADVFEHLHLQRFVRRAGPNHNRHPTLTRQYGGLATTLTDNNHVAAVSFGRANHQRVNHAHFLNGVSEPLEVAFFNVLSRMLRIRFDQRDIDDFKIG